VRPTAIAAALAVLLCSCGSSHRRRSAAATVGVLSQLDGAQGCVSADASQGCSQARVIEDASSIAVSTDGRNAYVTSHSGSGSIVVFERDAASGALVQLPGRSGCVIRVIASGCAHGRALLAANSVAVAPDGRDVYATASRGGVAVFRRSRGTGALTQLAGRDGCVTPRRNDGCAHQRALYGTDAIAVSPDGRNVYVAPRGEAGLVVFKRDRRRGTLSPLPGKAGCVTADPFRGCALGRALFEPASIGVSPDGRNVYVAAFAGDSLAIFRREPRTGALTQPAGKAGCVSIRARRSCVRGRALGAPSSIAVSPDGRSVYVTSLLDDAVVLLRRDTRTGAITQPSGSLGCISRGGAFGCARARAVDRPVSVVVSTDGRSVYVSSSSPEGRGEVAVFGRDRSDGRLTQLPGASGCVNADGALGCTPARAVRDVGPMVVSPDDRSAYVVSITSSGAGSIAVFARRAGR
jgi:DNA-binding beta-propeller fold protein YncE